MRKRFVLLGLLGLLAVLGAMATQWLVSLAPGITRANYQRIQVGMSLPAVENLLGGEGAEPSNEPRARIWSENGIAVLVTLDESGHVATKSWNDLSVLVNIRQESFWDKLRRWGGF